MKITLNGKSRETENNTSLSILIEQCAKEKRHIVAEINGQIVKSGDWISTPLHDGDTVELVSFIGGG